MARLNRTKIETELETLYGCTMYGRFKTFGIKTEDDAKNVVEICNAIEGRIPKTVQVKFGSCPTSGKDSYEVGGCIYIEYTSSIYHNIYITP